MEALQIQNLVHFKRDFYHKKELPLTHDYISDVLITVCETLGVRIVDVLGNRRFRELVNARSIIARICSDKVNDPEKLKYRGQQGWTMIGRVMGKPHCTVIHWRNVFDVDIRDEDFKWKYERCLMALNEKGL